MFDLGLMELLLIGITALIVVGPKDLPVMFRDVGRFMGRMRGMARDFRRAMEDAAEEAGVRDVERDLRGLTSAKKLGLGEVEEAARSMADWKMPSEAPRTAPKANAAAREVREAAARRAAQNGADQNGAARQGVEAAETSAEPDEEASERPPEPVVEPAGGAKR